MTDKYFVIYKWQQSELFIVSLKLAVGHSETTQWGRNSCSTALNFQTELLNSAILSIVVDINENMSVQWN